MCCVPHPPPRNWCPLVCSLPSCASAARICSMLCSLLLLPSSSWLSTPALSAVEGLVFPRDVPVFSSPLWLSGRLYLLLSETSWVQQLNSWKTFPEKSTKESPDSYNSCPTPLYSESLICFPRTCFPCLETRANTSQVTEPRLMSLALPSLSELGSGISVYFGALSDSLFLRDLYLCHPCA